MMRGFIVGSLALIAVYAVLQKGAADRIGSGGNALVGLARRFFDASVAGVPDRSGGAHSGSQPTPPSAQGESGLGKAGKAGGGAGGGGGNSW
jgi:hypothetical protein